MITAEFARDRLDYNQETGVLTWKTKPVTRKIDAYWNRRYAGTEAGFSRPFPYRSVKIVYDGKKRTILEHLLIWLIMTGSFPEAEIDHVDHDGENNSWANLRAASRDENARNRIKSAGTKFAGKGVSVNARGRYFSRIGFDNKRLHLGMFNTPEEAAEAYNKAALKLHGEFASPLSLDSP